MIDGRVYVAKFAAVLIAGGFWVTRFREMLGSQRRALESTSDQKSRSLELVGALGTALGELDTAGLIGVPGTDPKDPVAEAWNEYFAANETAREGHFNSTLLHARAAVDALTRFAAGHIDAGARDQILDATTTGTLAQLKTHPVAPVGVPTTGDQIESLVSNRPPARRGADSLVWRQVMSRQGDSLTNGPMTVRGDLVYRGIVNGKVDVLSGHLDFKGKINGPLNVWPGASAVLHPGIVVNGSVSGDVNTNTARINGLIV